MMALTINSLLGVQPYGSAQVRCSPQRFVGVTYAGTRTQKSSCHPALRPLGTQGAHTWAGARASQHVIKLNVQEEDGMHLLMTLPATSAAWVNVPAIC